MVIYEVALSILFYFLIEERKANSLLRTSFFAHVSRLRVIITCDHLINYVLKFNVIGVAFRVEAVSGGASKTIEILKQYCVVTRGTGSPGKPQTGSCCCMPYSRQQVRTGMPRIESTGIFLLCRRNQELRTLNWYVQLHRSLPNTNS